MNPRDFYGEQGRTVAPMLRRFARYVAREAKIAVQGPARVMKSPMGRRVVYEPAAQVFPGSFQVRKVGAKLLSISEGLVGGLVPYLEGVRLDGLDLDGEPLPEGPPRLTCEPPESADRSYVLLWARHNEGGEVDETIEQDSADPAAYLEHALELPPGMRMEDRVARLVAVIYWRGEQIAKLRQVVWYDQEVWPVGGKARMRAAA